MRLLLARSRELAYASASFFMDRMGEALEGMGHSVTRLDIDLDGSAGGESPDSLEGLHRGSFDAIIDFNSNLPRLEEDGRPWLDVAGIPFFNYVIDHPLYHHRGLAVPLEHYHVICIDRQHAEWVRRHYHHVRQTALLPLAGTEPLLARSFANKEDSVLLPATYEPKAGRLPSEVCDFIRDDQIRRNRDRLAIARKVAESGTTLVLMGHGWEETELSQWPHVKLLSPRPMMNAINTMARYRYVVDVNPLFPCGMHDRVPSILAAGSVCITTMNPAFDPGLIDGENIIYYKEGMGFDIKNAAAVAAAGQQYYQKHLTWETHAQRLTEILFRAR